MKRVLSFITISLVAVAMIFAQGSAETASKSQSFPTKDITITVPVNAGGGSDTLARAISAVADKYFNHSIIVVNRGGAGGTIGATEFLTNKPDGYNLLLAHAAIFTTQPKLQKVQYTASDFKGVIGLNNQPIVLAVTADSPFKSFDDVVNCGRQIKIAANSVGSIFHVGAMDLMNKAKIDAVHVPFNGNSAALTGLIGKNVDIGFFHPEEIISHVQAGTIRVLGTMTAERIDAFKDVPTFKELGYDCEYGVWKALLVPAGTSQEVVDYLNATFNELFQDPEFLNYVNNTSTNMYPISGEEVDKKLIAEVDSYADIIDALNLSSKK